MLALPLQIELEKAQAKINEARARTKAIREHRSQIEERNRAKEAELARRQREAERIRQASRIARERVALSRQSNEQAIESLKRQEARKLVEEHAKNLELIQMQREQSLQRAREMKAAIVQQHQDGRRSREQLLDQRRQRAEDTFRGKLLEEAERSQDHEHRVSSMERRERELIDLLAQAQEEQRRAYAELEEALLASHGRTHAPMASDGRNTGTGSAGDSRAGTARGSARGDANGGGNSARREGDPDARTLAYGQAPGGDIGHGMADDAAAADDADGYDGEHNGELESVEQPM